MQELDDLDLIYGKNNLERDSDDESVPEDAADLAQRRLAYVRRCIRHSKNGTPRQDRFLAYAEARRDTIKEFYGNALRTKRCSNCKAYSNHIRKSGRTEMTLWRKPLTPKMREFNTQWGHTKTLNSALWLQEYKQQQQRVADKALAKQRRQDAQHSDEGVADLDSSEDSADEIRVLDGPLEGDQPSYLNDQDEEVNTEEEGSGDDLVDKSTLEDNAAASDEARRSSTHTKRTGQNEKAQNDDKDEPIRTTEAYASLVQLFQKEDEVLGKIYSTAKDADGESRPSPDRFFIQCLLVPPNKYRREQMSQPGRISESEDNTSYKNVLNTSEQVYRLQREIAGENPSYRPAGTFKQLEAAYTRLQQSVNCLIDKDYSSSFAAAKMREPEGIKQKLERKEGMFRMNIMGKRVNFCGRSVISPDPNIDTTEIGIPEVFAKKLTYPEPVFEGNYAKMKEAIMIGPGKLSGAAAIEMENGQVINLRRKTDEDRQAMANTLLVPSGGSATNFRPKKIHRYLRNGDMVIMNRQPSLHKPSMMAHRARILPGEKTIRMHYANCKSYNADFDGDEMNLHFPQTPTGQAEASEIANTDLQYLSATAGEPLRGLVQDHVAIGVRLTSLDSFFTRDEYHQLLYTSLQDFSDPRKAFKRIITMDPAILKPKPLWSGKQVITTILENIRDISQGSLIMDCNCSVSRKSWESETPKGQSQSIGMQSQEGELRIRNGELVTGVLDKKNIGNSQGGLVHMVYEAYGAEAAGRFLSILGRLLTLVLNMSAISCGVEDLILTPKGDAMRAEKMVEADTIGIEVAARYVSMNDQNPSSEDSELLRRLEEVYRDDAKLAGLDQFTSNRAKSLHDAISLACLPAGLAKPFPRNQFQLMVVSGAKGSQPNANQICSDLGQQALEGRRVPVMISGKTLPSFKCFETSVRAGGFIADRFITGLRPQEYYFHAMSGREGLIDTAVKTSRSGYLQRCLVKGLEGLTVGYDTSVRDTDGTIVQTMYGEDGVDVTKQSGLTNFAFISKNFLSLFAKLDVMGEASVTRSKDAMEYNKSAVKAVLRGRPNVPDPVLSVYTPSSHAGSTSEKYYRLVKAFLDENPGGIIRSKKSGNFSGYSKTHVIDIFNLNYLKALVQPGDAIGVVAAQSIGEPSTQMTLNTFHLAGHAAKNVTLGVPRLREILMAASVEIKTPTMALYFHDEMSKWQRETFARAITRRSFAELMDAMSVEDQQIIEGGRLVAREYRVSIRLFLAEHYKTEYSTSVLDVSRTIDWKFMPLLCKRIKGRSKKKTDIETMQTFDVRRVPQAGGASDRDDERDEADATLMNAAQNEGGDSDIDDGGDNDATDAKQRANRDEGLTYEDEVESDEEAEDRDASPGAPDVPDDEAYGSGEGSTAEQDQTSKRKPQEPHNSLASSDRHRLDRLSSKNPELMHIRFAHSEDDSSLSFVLRYDSDQAYVSLLDLVKEVANAVTIQSVPNITTASLLPINEDDEASEKYVLTSGQNLLALRDWADIIDPHRMRTNDIGAMLRLYGVEAARSAIIAELQGVFKAHNITVDVRHLTLVADYMTQSGGYKAFSRAGMRSEPEVFKKMSFETTLGFLKDAVLDGEIEELKGPSARITVGRPMRGGTGMCDILTDVSERRREDLDEDETHDAV
ncbi:MAG: hypothetical protein M1828_006871 [Chrysothrix sp. TS-e1954]|nr:MAG: hypothetical protein M1828_006871 [Chrysothrix sp. TS-e1954]